MEMPKVGGTYRHYRGQLYRVLYIGEMSNTPAEGHPVVIYRSMDPKGNPIRVRTLEGFDDSWNMPHQGQSRFVEIKP